MTIPQAIDLALEHHRAGRLAEAETIYRQVLAIDPRHAGALHLLGVLAHQAGRSEAAVPLIQQAIAVAPDIPDFHSNLGEAMRTLGRWEEAVAACRAALVLQPESAVAHNNLGLALHAQGRLDEAIAACRRAIALQPELALAHNNLGNMLSDQGHAADAIAAFRRAIQLQPDYAEAHNNLGCTLAEQGSVDEAIAAYRRAIELQPHLAEAHNNLGRACKDLSQLDKAIACYRCALTFNAHDAATHSNLIYALHFHPDQDTLSIQEEHRRWHRQFADPLRKLIRPHGNDRDPERRLRIGYVSPDFTRHVICHFLIPLLETHDPTQVERFCYASVQRPDGITARARKSAEVWRDVLGLPDDRLADLIREDRIDILVDLTQHMAGNRLLVFARKPAPVQVAWVGYPASTGLEAMDYRLTDSFLEPEGTALSASVESPVRLPGSWFCFDPIETYPEPGELPALMAGYVTFACLNNFAKVNDGVLNLWARLLSSVEDSRLLLQCPAGETQARVRQLFEAQGIAPHRLELITRTATRAEFLALFAQIDIALDPFPYNGGTTTCEALWMGVPVPAFPGSRAISRLGLSILSAAGLQEWVAASEADYLRLVVSLANDLPRMAELRATLRQRMKVSAFMDAPRFARNVEQAYRNMWRRWCRGGH